jgi:hypothetical protein
MATIAKLLATAELDTSGFDKGITSIGDSVDDLAKTTDLSVAKMGAGFSRLGVAAAGMLKVISLGAAALVLSPIMIVLTVLIGLIALIKASVTSAISIVGKNSNKGIQDIKNSMFELKLAFANMFAPLITLAIPYIKLVINWLIRLFNMIAMITAAWTGQAQVMQIIAGSVSASANGMNSLRKAAMGALAAFDQINVLQTKDVSMNDVGTEMVPVTAQILTNVNAIKAGWAELVQLWNDSMAGWGMLWDWLSLKWTNAMTGWGMLWDWLVLKWNDSMAGWGMLWDWLKIKGQSVWDGFLLSVENFKLAGKDAWNNFLLALENFKLKWNEAWAGFVLAWDNMVLNLKLGWDTFWTNLKLTWDQAIIDLKLAWSNLGTELELAWDELWVEVDRIASNTWDSICEVWNNASAWFSENVTEPVRIFFSNAWSNVKLYASDAWDSVQAKWAIASAWFNTNITEPIKLFFSNAWENIKIYAGNAWDWIQEKWTAAGTWFSENVTGPIGAFFSDAWSNIKIRAQEAWDSMKEIFAPVGEWFQLNISDPIHEAFDNTLTWVQDTWEQTFDGLAEFLRNTVNNIIGSLNGMLSGMVDAINAIIDAINAVSSLLGWDSIPNISAPQIPYLAEGAVIPPNAPFAAMVGDQTSGNNIEAPEELIRQIVREETGKMQADIRIEFGGSLSELVRELKPYIDKENVRVGGSLVRSSATL